MSVAPGLRITVRFLQPYSHGRGEDGLPEWPPSPLRLFQALVASSIGHARDSASRERAAESLRWLERQGSPEIAAPVAVDATPYRLFVPDNVGDKVGKAWSSGRESSVAEFRTEKDVRPLRLRGEAVHYLFRDGPGVADHVSTIQRMARSLTHLGWGVDMVAGDADARLDATEGEHWIPGRRGGTSLRSPVEGTFEALERRHELFLTRLDGGTFRPVPSLEVYSRLPYARATDIERAPAVAFRLLDPKTARPLWLDAARRARDVAAWVRHAVGEVCHDWPYGSTRAFVHGHRDDGGVKESGARLFFLPLPTLNPRLSRVENIARVLIAAPAGHEQQLAWIEARLSGQDLVWMGKTTAFLDPLPMTDWVVRQYVEASDCWSTVTPVVLPGYDDRSPRKAEKLLRRALLQAGLRAEVVDAIRALEWRGPGFRRGTELASRYFPPDKVDGTRYHVRVRFDSPIAGPLAVGSGRFRGMGVFARELPRRIAT